MRRRAASSLATISSAAVAALAFARAPVAHAGGATFQPAGSIAKCTTAPEVSIAIHVVARGVWLGASTGARCFVPRKDAALDPAALDTELQTLVGSLPIDCSRDVSIAGDPGVSYQDVITAIDHAMKAGLADVALSDPKHLAIHFDDSAAREQKAPHCTAPASPAKPAPAASKAPASTLAPPPAKPDLAAAPIVTISRTELALDGKKVADVKTIAHGKGKVAALVTALRARASGDQHAVILDADASTDAGLVNRVIASAQQAGFDDVLFAVKTP
jgi:biopolymer transport protein ExbD